MFQDALNHDREGIIVGKPVECGVQLDIWRIDLNPSGRCQWIRQSGHFSFNSGKGHSDCRPVVHYSVFAEEDDFSWS